jgi:GNAT superfamily N-acetyltransferase
MMKLRLLLQNIRRRWGAEGMTANQIIRSIQEGQAIIKRRDFGFAIIQPEDRPHWGDSPGLHIWIIYIDPDERGKGKGKRFVKELITAYGQKYFTSVTVFGGKRGSFFGRCGFRITERDSKTGMRRMETWR